MRKKRAPSKARKPNFVEIATALLLQRGQVNMHNTEAFLTARSRPLLGILLVACLACTAANAQEVEEVVIQGTQTENSTLDDLVSVSALDAEKLADAGIENIEDVAEYVPNLVLSETSTGTAIVIRGIGAGVNQGFDQSVGLYVDGVPLPRSQMARAPFLDLGGVQVLRGPQYVKDGNYSIAGSVHMLTKEADDEFQLGIDVNYVPSQNDKKLLITLGTPLADWGAMRLAVQKQTADGYIENVTLQEDGPQVDDLLVRGVFSFNPTNNLAIKLKVEQGSFDRRGRQIEIIDSQATPDYRLFPEVQGPNGTILRDPSPIPPIKTGNLLTVLPELRNEQDYILDVVRSLYDVEYATAGVPAFAGLTYGQVLQNLYTDEQDIKTIQGFSTSNGAIEPPAGLLDSSVDFKRAANELEFSNNDTINFTLNTNYWLGEHQLKLIASYIEYEVTELIDTDFTPVPILATLQSEEYQQNFYRFEYVSPRDSFLEYTVGLSHLESELSIDESIKTRLGGPTDQASTEQFILENWDADGFDLEQYITFNPDTPFVPYFGRILPVNISSLQVFSPDRDFDQETQITAAFGETTINFTDSFRATLGARYTRAKKAAVRDFAFLLKNGEAFVWPDEFEATVAQLQITQALASLYNFGQHTDRSIVSDGNPGNSNGRCDNVNSWALGGPCDPDPNSAPSREEKLLPSITLAWDINEDLSINASIRKANKLGGFDARSVSTPTTSPGIGLQPGTFRFEDEDATSIEFGTKWYLPNGLGLINATAFHTSFKNLQVSTSDRSVGFNVRNAGAAESYGIEVEGQLQASEKFSINYSLAWINFEFTDFKFGSCNLSERPDYFLISEKQTALNAVLPIGTLTPIIYEDALPVRLTLAATGFGITPFNRQALDTLSTGDFYNAQRFDFRALSSATFCDFKGKTNQYVAEYQGTFSFNYLTEIANLGVVKPTLDVVYNSGYQTTVTQDDDVAQDSYFLLNGRLSLGSFDETWEWALVGKNLTNEKVVGYASEVPIATRIQGSKTHLGFVRPPRAIGLNFRYNFY